jgi:hypothetical protein
MSDRYSEVAQRIRVDVAAAVRRAQRRHIMRLAARYTAVVIVTAGLVTGGVLARKYVQSLAGPWRLLLTLLLWLTIAVATYLIASLRRSAILPPSGLELGRVGQNVWRSVVRFTMKPAPLWVTVLALATVLIAAGALAYDNWPVAAEWRVSSDPLASLSLGAAVLVAGALARVAFRRLRTSHEQRSGRRSAELADDFRAEPHTRPVEVTVEPVPDSTQTFTVRLVPHPDPGTQTLREVT